MKSNTFKNKVVIITGSSGGIGKKTALKLAELGAKVVLNGRNERKLRKTYLEIKTISKDVFSVCADISNEEEATILITKTVEKFGKIDILINNAGVSMRGDFANLKPEVFNRVFTANVFGVTNTTIKALPYIKKTMGSIVFISSVAGIRGLPGLSAYCASKLSLQAIAESLRIEESKSGIHIGLIYVGMTEVDHRKKTISADGSLVTLESRAGTKVQTTNQVAESILKNIRKRKFIMVLSRLGKLNYYMQKFMPFVVEKIIIASAGKIKNRSS